MKSSTVNKERFSRKQVMTLIVIDKIRNDAAFELTSYSHKGTISSLVKKGVITQEDNKIRLTPKGKEMAPILEKKHLSPIDRLNLHLNCMFLRNILKFLEMEKEMRASFPNFKAFDLNPSTL